MALPPLQMVDADPVLADGIEFTVIITEFVFVHPDAVIVSINV